MRILLGAAAAMSLLMLSACDTTSPVAAYTPSTANVLAFQSAMKSSGATVKVGDFTSAAGVEKPGCRMVGTLDVTAGKPLGDYLKDALQTELFTAGVYDVNSPVVITGRLDSLKVNTFGTGSWTVGVTVFSNKYPEGYHVETTRPFATSYVATSACHNATNAFAPTVQAVLADIVASKDFNKLIGKS